MDPFDAEGRERLARYGARACLSLERLSIDSDGQVLYSLKRSAPGAPAVLTLSPTEFLAKLVALIPPPRSHLVRYHGVFSPHCKQRNQIVPGPTSAESVAPARPAGAGSGDVTAAANPIEVPAGAAAKPVAKKRRRSTYRLDWASLLKRVFALDVMRCERGGGEPRPPFCFRSTIAPWRRGRAPRCGGHLWGHQLLDTPLPDGAAPRDAGVISGATSL